MEHLLKRDYELIDVCHTIEHGLITYKGLPAPVITDHLTREDSRKIYVPGTEFQIGRIEMVANTERISILSSLCRRRRPGRS